MSKATPQGSAKTARRVRTLAASIRSEYLSETGASDDGRVERSPSVVSYLYSHLIGALIFDAAWVACCCC
jgi:hypothetical protein